MIYVVADIRDRREPTPDRLSFIGDVKGITFNKEHARALFQACTQENRILPEEDQGIIRVYEYAPDALALYAADGTDSIATIFIEGCVSPRSFKKVHTPKQYKPLTTNRPATLVKL